LDMAYPSSVGCDLGGDQPTGYAILSACFHTPEITITQAVMPSLKSVAPAYSATPKITVRTANLTDTATLTDHAPL